jgi:prophage maintenance system killer protein
LSHPEDPPRGDVVVYQSPDGEVRVDVRLDQDTVWLSLDQMAALFGRHRTVVSKHLRNVFASKELERTSVSAKFAPTASDGKVYAVDFFNLDAILSVGYRVNSRRGTQFRIWATRTLRQHLLHGYSLHERRLRERGLGEVRQAIDLLARTLATNQLVTDEGRAVLDVVQRYARTWHWLFEYDEDRLPQAPGSPVAPATPLTLVEARGAIAGLREALARHGQAGDLFGRERDGALAGLLGAIEQTFDGLPLYRSAQARAAHLLYFTVKDHPFADGNKRIGALLFLECLRRHGLLLRPDGQPRLADTATAALTLLIAESRPAQKDLMVRLVMSLLGDAETPGATAAGEPRVGYGRRARPRPAFSARRAFTILRTTAAGSGLSGVKRIVPLLVSKPRSAPAWAASTAGLMGKKEQCFAAAP